MAAEDASGLNIQAKPIYCTEHVKMVYFRVINISKYSRSREFKNTVSQTDRHIHIFTNQGLKQY